MEVEKLLARLKKADPSKEWKMGKMPEGAEFEAGFPVVGCGFPC
jgi:hypothetical protein